MIGTHQSVFRYQVFEIIGIQPKIPGMRNQTRASTSRDQRDTMLTLTHAACSSCGATAKMNDILDNVWTVFQRKTIAGAFNR